MKETIEFYEFVQKVKTEGHELQRLVHTNQREERLALRNQLRQEIILRSQHLTQEQVTMLLGELEKVFNLLSHIVYSEGIDEEEKGDAVSAAIWDLSAHAHILKGVQKKTLQDIFLLYDWAKMFFEVKESEDFKNLAESLRETANAAIEDYVTESYSEQKAIVDFFCNKVERVVHSLPALTDESILQDKLGTLAFALGIIFQYKPDYAVAGDSFSEACRERWTRIHGYFELERRTHLSFYFETACHIRACLKAQILLEVERLDSQEREEMVNVLSERIDWLNARMAEGAEKAGGLKEVAFAEYARALCKI